MAIKPPTLRPITEATLPDRTGMVNVLYPPGGLTPVKGDGVTNDTPAIMAIDQYLAARGQAGILLWPATNRAGAPSQYLVNGTAFLTAQSYTWFAWGATFVKKVTPYAFFADQGGAEPGYGSGLNNFTIFGGTFRGSFAAGAKMHACAFAFMHTRKFLAEGTNFIEMQGGGHTADLCGVEDITFRRCTFQGFDTSSATSGIERSECIQIDQAGKGSPSSVVPEGWYDGLFARRVVVDHCEFLPITVGGVTYPCPNPIAAHSVRDQHWYEKIEFTDNHVIDPIVDTGTHSFRGTLHFPPIKGLKINGNTFKRTFPAAHRLISIFGIDDATLPSSDPNTAPSVAGPVTPMGAEDIEILDNTFDGFAPAEGQTAQYTIHLGGIPGGLIKNVKIRSIFRGGATSATAPGEVAIYATYTKGLSILPGNLIEGYDKAIYVNNSEELEVDGRILDCNQYQTSTYGVYLNATTVASVKPKMIRQRKPIYCNLSSANFAGGIYHDVRSAVGDGAINIAGGTGVSAQGLVIRCLDQTHATGITVYGTSTDVVAGNYVVTGTTVKTKILGTTTVNVVIVENQAGGASDADQIAAFDTAYTN